MRYPILFALTALIPASLNAAAPPTSTVVASTCGGGVLALTIPLRPDAPAHGNGRTGCAKGCHTGTSRKRFLRHC